MKPRIEHVETDPHRSFSPVHVLLLRSNLWRLLACVHLSLKFGICSAVCCKFVVHILVFYLITAMSKSSKNYEDIYCVTCANCSCFNN